MLLVERHIIKKHNPLFDELDDMTFLSKNLYNQTLYRVKQCFFNTKTYLKYSIIVKQLAKEMQPDYTALPAKVSQCVVKQVDQDFKSFFGSLKSKNISHKVSMPHYLDKDGRNLLGFTNQAISKKELKNGWLKLSGCKNKIKILHTNVNQVRVLPRGTHFVIEVVYEKEEKQHVDTGVYVGIDIGVNNLATVGSNKLKPVIVNGKPLKSINQYYNKELAKLRSRQDKCNNKLVNSKKIKTLTFKRNNKINDYLHKQSRVLVNHLVSNGVSTVVIGHNKNWKQDINIGKANNQKFVQIPFCKFINMITYKAQLNGIDVIQREESYTSKCSFLDNEEICKHEQYVGKRVKRGLFKSHEGRLINADLNGALNILRKEIPNAFSGYGIEVSSTPVVLITKHLA